MKRALLKTCIFITEPVVRFNFWAHKSLHCENIKKRNMLLECGQVLLDGTWSDEDLITETITELKKLDDDTECVLLAAALEQMYEASEPKKPDLNAMKQQFEELVAVLKGVE